MASSHPRRHADIAPPGDRYMRDGTHVVGHSALSRDRVAAPVFGDAVTSQGQGHRGPPLVGYYRIVHSGNQQHIGEYGTSHSSAGVMAKEVNSHRESGAREVGSIMGSGTPLVDEGLFSVEPPALLGGHCRDCGQMCFPAAARCPFCRAASVAVTPLPTLGTVYSYTISRIPGPGYRGPVPYGFGLVELGSVIRVASLLNADPIERLRIGARVRFALVNVGTADDPLLSYSYELGQ
jgi:uncharacterized OB-fold protein